MKTAFTPLTALALPLTALRAQPAPRPLQLSDLSRLRVVADPQLSLDGAWVTYTVTRADSVTNKRDADVVVVNRLARLGRNRGSRYNRAKNYVKPHHCLSARFVGVSKNAPFR